MKRWLVVVVVCLWSLPARAAITMTPNPVDVGGVLLGDTATAVGTLSSSTSVQVDLVIGTCSGGGGTFTLQPANGISLSSPKSITVSYTPSARGTRACTVNVFQSGSPTMLGSFSVRGTGQAPAMMSISGTTDFGSVRWNDAASVHTSSRNFTVTNAGDQTLTISNVTITGANAGDYAITTGGTSATIPPGSARSWIITFDPAAMGSRTAIVTFISNAPSNGTQSLSLTGTGTNAVIAVSDVNFGVVTTGSSAAADIIVSNTGGAPKGNLGVTSATITGGAGWITFSGCGAGTTCTFAPPLSIPNSAVVGIRCSPPATAAANDMQAAMVTFTSDADNMTDRISNITCVAGKSDLATSISTVTFAPQLVGTTTAPLAVTVSNNGNLSATFYLLRTGANASQYAAATTSGCGTSGTNQCNLPPGGTAGFTVTFSPTFEGDIAAGLNVVANATPYPQLTLAGRGVDRHIEVAPVVFVEDTYRTMARVVPVTINNIGEYPLQITDVAVTGDPAVWALVDPFAPFEVPGLASHDLDIRFSPLAVGKAPDATVAITSDDRFNPMTTVILSGNGKDRNVQVGPGTIDFGDRSVGVTTRLSDLDLNRLLSVLNMDEVDFRLREARAEGSGAEMFAVVRGGYPVGDLALRVGTVEQFDVLFTPTREGELEATLALYLDDDVLPHASIPVRGRALTVDVRGGGGCSTGGGGSLVLAFAALFVRRRRR